ncbi:glycosyltransferase family 4 protein [Verrucomicrobia bacterium]|nr:glycosyltransferase family 4 protein [Verrucomicrobiota bacterium]
MSAFLVHIGCPYFPYNGGSSVRLSKLLGQCKVDGLQLIVVTPTEGEFDEKDSVQIWRGNPYSREMIRRVWRHVRGGGKVTVVLHNVRALIAWRIFGKRWSNLNVVTEIHNFLDYSWWKLLLVKRLYRQTDQVLALGESAAEMATSRYGVDRKKVTTIRNGVTAGSPRPSFDVNDSGRIRYAYVGTFHDWQGVLVIAQALARLSEPVFNRCTFDFVGGGPMFSDFERIVVGNIPSEFINIHGWVEKTVADAVVSKADVMLMPRLSTIGTETIIPLKAVEALEMGKAVIAADVGGMKDVLECCNTRFVRPGDVDDLILAIAELANDPARVVEMKKQAFSAYQKQPTWDVIGQMYRSALEL